MAAAGDEVDASDGFKKGLAAAPVAGAPEPVLDLVQNTLDRCAYLALLGRATPTGRGPLVITTGA